MSAVTDEAERLYAWAAEAPEERAEQAIRRLEALMERGGRGDYRTLRDTAEGLALLAAAAQDPAARP